MVMFHSYVNVYQRVAFDLSKRIPTFEHLCVTTKIGTPLYLCMHLSIYLDTQWSTQVYNTHIHLDLYICISMYVHCLQVNVYICKYISIYTKWIYIYIHTYIHTLYIYYYYIYIYILYIIYIYYIIYIIFIVDDDDGSCNFSFQYFQSPLISCPDDPPNHVNMGVPRIYQESLQLF